MAPAAIKKFRVLIVDDSAFMRKVLETIFNADDQLQVAGHAKDGREAIALAESLKPDVITMGIDLDMQSVKDDLLRKVRMAAKVRVVRTASRVALTVQGANGSAAPAKSAPMPVRTTPVIPADQRFPVVVLGASTGGPATVMRLAPGFTRDFPAAVFLVQHMPAP